MNIIIYLNEKKTDTDYKKAIEEYTKRISAFAKTEIILFKNLNELNLNKNSYKFLVRTGKSTIGSEEFAKKITDINLSGYSCIEFYLSENAEMINSVFNLLQEKDTSGSHEFLEITGMHIKTDALATALTEQVYRAYTINNHISYHK